MRAQGPEHRIAAAASRQYGVVSRAQLAALGLSRGQIQRRVEAGRLHRVHRGVYAVGHRAPRPEARWLAAVLACGERAVLSHRSAGVLWQIVSIEGALPDVTTGEHRRTPGVRCHVSPLTAADVTTHRRITVTTPARTLADLAHVLEPADLTRSVREAQFRRLGHLPSMLAVLERRPSRRLRTLLEHATATQSHLEDRLLAICDRHRIPRPQTQQHIAGARVDFLWPAERLVVETDGYDAHTSLHAFQNDRTTANALQLTGHTILRFTRADLADRPRDVADQIRAALLRSAA